MCSAALSLACLLRTQTKTSPQPPVVSKLLSSQLRTLFLPTPVQSQLVSTSSVESLRVQGITTHRNLAGESIPASAASVSAALSPQQLLTGRTDLLPDETHRPQYARVCVCSGTRELQLQVASRSGLAWWWIRTAVQLSTEVDWGQ